MKRLVVALITVGLVAMPTLAAVDGAAVYAAKCKACHGADGKGKTPLAGTKLSVDDIVKVTTDGKAPKMPAYKGKISPDEIKAVAEFVKSLK